MSLHHTSVMEYIKMPRIDHADRTHVILLFERTVKETRIESFLWDYRCSVCEGKLEAIAVIEDNVIIEHTITCHTCGTPAGDVKHVRTIRRETIAFQDVLDGLPAHLRAMIEQPLLNEADAEAAAGALYE